jgi:hypothetical protein
MQSDSKRIILYYQTLIDLQPLIDAIETYTKSYNTPLVTHITLASIHFGYDSGPDNTPYIHLNDDSVFSDKFKTVYENLLTLNKMGVKINLLIGGAGGAFNMLFSNYPVFYKLLKGFVESFDFIDGFNLDVEEGVTLDDIVMLVNDLKKDFPSNSIIFAPLGDSISTNEPGMGGFSYKDLKDKVGDSIEYYNTQCYGDYSLEMYDQMVNNNYNANQLVIGMLTGQDFNSIINEIHKIVTKYGDKFGGVAIWEYYNAPPSSPKTPYIWCEVMNKLLYH